MHHLIMCRNYFELWLLLYYATLQALPDNKVVLWNRFMKVITSDVYHINTETQRAVALSIKQIVGCAGILRSPAISSIIKARKCLFEIISDLASHACSKPQDCGSAIARYLKSHIHCSLYSVSPYLSR